MKYSVCLTLIAFVALAGLAFSAHALDPVLRDMESAFIRIGEEVRPCVVNIEAKGGAGPETMPNPEQWEDLFKYFSIPIPEEGPRRFRMQRPTATASGFIFDKQGHIITNNHVVADAARIIVKLWDEKEYEAKVVGRDEDTDVAVIKIEPDRDLPVARLGDSDSLKVGQFAIAVGNPGGLEGTLSFGHISALGRENLRLPRELRIQGFIQTDAAINLGNSGGPLCNIEGEVIGINTAIVMGAESLGFAMPINTAKKVVPELISTGSVVRGYLGVGIKDAKEYAEAVGLPDEKGAFVEQVNPDTPAARAGIKINDVIRKVNGETVEGSSDLVNRISAMAPGSTANLEVWRKENSVQLQAQLDKYAGSVEKATQGREVVGLRVQSLTSELAENMGLPSNTKGVVVSDVEPGSAAEDAGIRHGDIIVEVAQEPVANTDDFYRLMQEQAQPGKPVLIRVMGPRGEASTRVLKVPQNAKVE
ncbi:MAG: trypsin-like peptidase domain-containing protein [Candidatus Hydrogenedentes bacterium]|nr:trypsin-like peptidase domain-containing protein [Candidatus Hydrogenedentota bacterium]